MKWIGDALPAVAQTLPAPPQHEWLEAVKYWNGGGRAPVWFVVDPLRTSIDLVQHGDPRRFRWAVPYPVLLSGARPNEMDWYRVDRPEWYVGEGWALTPEAAGVADADRRGPSRAPIDGWIRGVGVVWRHADDRRAQLRSDAAAAPDGPPRRPSWSSTTPWRRAFLRFVSLPLLSATPRSRAYDASRRCERRPAARVAIEQFDVSATRPLVGFGDGWHEQEFNPRTGLRWRWLSERGELRSSWNRRIAERDPLHPEHPLALHLEGESPRKYFSRGSRLVVRSARSTSLVDRRVERRLLARRADRRRRATRSCSRPIRSIVPAERSRRSADRRHLGLRMFKVAEIQDGRPRPAS